MAYELTWSKSHPGHVVYLLDLSGSMSERGKIDILIDAVTEVVTDLIADASPSGNIEDYMTLTIIGYNYQTKTLINNFTLQQLFDHLSAEKPLIDKNGTGKPEYQTCTADGFRAVAREIRSWIDGQKKAGREVPAPLVVHITDGYPYEGKGKDAESVDNAIKAANELKAISTPDGNVRLFNIHIEPNYPTFHFPTSRPSGSSDILKQIQFLYDTATPVDELSRRVADFKLEPGLVKSGSRFMVSNASGQGMLSRFIQFGSTPGSTTPNNPYQEEVK